MDQVKIIRCSRSTLNLKVLPDGSLVMRVPYGISDGQIREFLRSRETWIRNARERLARRAEELQAAGGPYTEAELKALKQEAAGRIAERVAFYLPQVGVSVGRITVRAQKSRWGSCSSKGNLNFNCVLALVPQEVLDCIVVHELCHRKVMNHSEAFYREVLRVLPSYREGMAWLKQNEKRLLQRLPK